MNSTPARSRAVRSALTASSETWRRTFSKSTTVERPSPAAFASCDWEISNNDRAARHCVGIIFSTIYVDASKSTFYVDRGLRWARFFSHSQLCHLQWPKERDTVENARPTQTILEIQPQKAHCKLR